jgi:hypothetical protein
VYAAANRLHPGNRVAIGELGIDRVPGFLAVACVEATIRRGAPDVADRSLAGSRLKDVSVAPVRRFQRNRPSLQQGPRLSDLDLLPEALSVQVDACVVGLVL